MSTYNFHGQIAIPLETTARVFFSENKLDIPVTADTIETGSFVSVMTLLLFIKYGSDSDSLRFLRKTSKFAGFPASAIPSDAALQLYQEFECLFYRKANSSSQSEKK